MHPRLELPAKSHTAGRLYGRGGLPQQIPSEYVRAQRFIREVRKSREKTATAAFFEIPDAAIQSILARAETSYDIPFDNDQWRLERARSKLVRRTSNGLTLGTHIGPNLRVRPSSDPTSGNDAGQSAQR